MKRRKDQFLLMIPVFLFGLLISTGCEKNGSTGNSIPEAPVILAQKVTYIYSAGATLKATLKENDLPAEVTFEYGTSLKYGYSVPGVPDPIFKSGTIMMAEINSLTKDTIYHFRVKAVNSAGTTYSKDMEFTPNFGIGESFGGGFIIYLDGSGEHGLIAAETDQTEGIIWDNGTNCKKTNITSTSIGSGQTNSARLVSILGPGNYPAKICDDLVLNGYSDWYLPSLQELDCMKKSLSVFDRKFNLNGIFYWTSSEAPESEGTQSCFAWVQSILTGEQRSWAKNDKTPYVRAIRSF
jgi:hypothetical protein